MKSNEIRQRFLDFFEDHDHQIIDSAPLLPSDPELLFNIAGMVPFKPYFLGEETPPDSRVTSSQKCLRTEDIEQVGFTARHQTFFEMLGNFSFGDYFKEEAIGYAWEFFVEELEMEEDQLWVTVFGGDEQQNLEADEEARDLWLEQTNIPEDRIIQLGTSENFWKMGSTGPCGPCSEILYDQGESDPSPAEVKEAILAGEDRFLELWNLVFMQFNRSEDGELSPLPQQNIDTGLGLERLAAVLQGADHNFETDLFLPLIEKTRQLAGLSPLQEGTVHEFEDQPNIHVFPDDDVSVELARERQRATRIVADHVRAASFLLAEGLIPGNEGRGYVLRRLIRRALRWGRKLDLHEPFLHELVPTLNDMMGDHYEELKENEELVIDRLQQEEEQFLRTLDRGMEQLQSRLNEVKEESDGTPAMSGESIFELYQTFGLPVELTQEILDEEEVEYDPDEIERAREKHQERSAGSWEGGRDEVEIEVSDVRETSFVGYDSLETESEVVRLFRDGRSINELQPGEEGQLILEETPFYPEGGGQVGDRGTIGGFSVTDTQSHQDRIVHYGTAEETISTGERVKARVDFSRRRPTMRHHTATHLLQAALRERLGDEVMQSGSLVDDEHLRFDFTYDERVPREVLDDVEERVNEWIYRELPVKADHMDRRQAEEEGALAFFGEHYGQEVRVVKIGDVSAEFCGGTHLDNAGELGLFTITDESSVAAGVRRIRARAGQPAFEYLKSIRERLQHVAGQLGVQDPDEASDRIDHLQEKVDEYEDELESLRAQQSAQDADELADQADHLDGLSYVAERFQGRDPEVLKSMIDEVKNRLEQGVVLLANESEDGSVQLLLGVTDELTDRINAGDWVGELGQLVGGGGGGRPDFAQAGGSNPEGIPDALDQFKEKLSETHEAVPGD